MTHCPTYTRAVDIKLRCMEPFHNNPTFTSCENCKSDMCAQKNACLLKSARGLKKRTKTLGRIFDALTMLAIKEGDVLATKRSTQWRQLPDGTWTQDAKDIKVKSITKKWSGKIKKGVQAKAHKATKPKVDLITPKPAGPLDSRQIKKAANMKLAGHEATQARVNNPKKTPPRNPRRPEVTGKENLRAGRQLQPARGKNVLVRVDIPGSLNDLDRIEEAKKPKKSPPPKKKVKRRKGPQKGVRGGGRGVNPSLLGKDKSTPLSVMKKHGNMKSTKIEKIARSKSGLKKAARILANTVRKAR
jgi:hypothetical protein